MITLSEEEKLKNRDLFLDFFELNYHLWKIFSSPKINQLFNQAARLNKIKLLNQTLDINNIHYCDLIKLLMTFSKLTALDIYSL